MLDIDPRIKQCFGDEMLPVTLTWIFLAAHECEWVAPISTSYRGYDAWEMPPNCQGITALIGLNILEGFDLAALERLQVHPGRRLPGPSRGPAAAPPGGVQGGASHFTVSFK